ncbi:hypothetical protein EV360DRAFT_85752 [Lentinula raphanica]|nr:hypothetical protein EV360DRAFT_85752 [Lentinula raphanica]
MGEWSTQGHPTSKSTISPAYMFGTLTSPIILSVIRSSGQQELASVLDSTITSANHFVRFTRVSLMVPVKDWATVPDGEFNPSKPENEKTDSLVVSDMYEHGPLWRTRKDGLPNFRDNGTPQDPQAFDVWVAFGLPPLISRTVQSEDKRPQDGTYRLVNTSANIVAIVKDGDSTEGSPIVTQGSTGGEEEMHIKAKRSLAAFRESGPRRNSFSCIAQHDFTMILQSD